MKRLSSLTFLAHLSALAGSSFVLAASVLPQSAGARPANLSALIEQKVSPPASSLFGVSLKLDGDTALISATGEDDNQGAAYFYTRVDGTWTKGQRIIAGDGLPDDQFGSPLGLQGNTAVISANSRLTATSSRERFTFSLTSVVRGFRRRN